MDQMAETAPWWAQYVSVTGVALIGSGAVILEVMRKFASGYSKAEARNLLAQAAKTEGEASQLLQNRSADFEQKLNDRTFRTMDVLENQIKHLSDLVEAQSLQITKQSEKMDHMEREIVSLRKVLDIRTSELNKVKANFPPVCHKCEFFSGTVCGHETGHCKLDVSNVVDIHTEFPLKSTKA